MSDDDLLTVAGLFFEANAVLERELERRLADECSISPQNFDVLIRLARTPGHRLRMSDLAAQTTLTPSGLTRAVDRLVEAGLVKREACPSDRRGSFATLTDAGAARMKEALPAHVAHLRDTLATVLTREQLDTLGELMRELRDALNPAGSISACS